MALRTRRAALIGAVVVWCGLVGVGLREMFAYSTTSGNTAATPARWPDDTKLVRGDDATVVMFVHPQCPCSRSSLAELATIGDASNATIIVVFAGPDVTGPSWDAAGRISHAVRVVDNSGEAVRFSALTSGFTLVYDRDGTQRFAGGITGSRGHTGANVGSDAVRRILAGEPSGVRMPDPRRSVTRQDQIFSELRDGVRKTTDRMFLWLLLAQWVFAIVLAIVLTPYTWTGTTREIHFHVKAAVGFGFVINSLPIALIVFRPGWWGTRHVVAVVQMMWSAMLIMITGGRIETHFHVFGSLAFLAFYRDWKVLVTATIAVAADHLARGVAWPDSVYGISNPEWWRFLEHAAWVAFEDIVLALGCLRGMRELARAAEREAQLETINAEVETLVATRTSELQDAMHRYRNLVETTDAIPFEYEHATRRVTYIAPQAARLLDCDPDDLLASGFFTSIAHPDDRARVRSEVDRFVAIGGTGGLVLDHRLIAKSNRVVYVRSFLSSTDGRVVRGVMLDITKQKQLELELQQAQKLESVGRLAAGVAHEINTPVQFVSDSVRFVREGVDDLMAVVNMHRESTNLVLSGHPSEQLARQAASAELDVDLPYLLEQFPQALDRALDGLDRVAGIVRSMKVFAHPDTKEMTAIDLNAAIASTLMVARNEYKYVADVVTDFGPVPPVSCHAGEINQVILNIIVNAAHAIADRKGTSDQRGTITVSTRVDDDAAVISIRDTGNGIPNDIRERVFEPFFTTKEVGRGTGQGLAIARSVVVDKHRGALTFETELNHGTTFHIRIPLCPHPAALAA